MGKMKYSFSKEHFVGKGKPASLLKKFCSIFKQSPQFQHLCNEIPLHWAVIEQFWFQVPRYIFRSLSKIKALTSAKLATAAISLQISPSEYCGKEIMFLISRGKKIEIMGELMAFTVPHIKGTTLTPTT